MRRLLRRWLGVEAVEYGLKGSASVFEMETIRADLTDLERRWNEGAEEDGKAFEKHIDTLLKGLSERISALERELDVEDASSISEATATTARRRRLWMESLADQPLSDEEKKQWEAGM